MRANLKSRGEFAGLARYSVHGAMGDSRQSTRSTSFSFVAVTLVGCLSILACSALKPIESAEDLAIALKDGGIAIQTQEPIDFSSMRFAKIDEGLSLRGESVRIDILRIEDERTFKVMVGAGNLLTGLGDLLESEAAGPPDTYVRRPFALIIREEPRPGEVREILSRLLPPEG